MVKTSTSFTAIKMVKCSAFLYRNRFLFFSMKMSWYRYPESDQRWCFSSFPSRLMRKEENLFFFLSLVSGEEGRRDSVIARKLVKLERVTALCGIPLIRKPHRMRRLEAVMHYSGEKFNGKEEMRMKKGYFLRCGLCLSSSWSHGM